MISLNACIFNPWSNRFDLVWIAHKRVTKYKVVELGLYKDHFIVGASLRISMGKEDHHGFSIGVHAIGFTFNFHFYDSRHSCVQ